MSRFKPVRRRLCRLGVSSLPLAVGLLACSGQLPRVDASIPQTGNDAERARDILARHPVFDGHNDLAWAIRRADAPFDVEAYDLREHTPGH
ncbi:MAG: hypothetical protein OEM96_08680, partial [Gemmatimonadota bacterium]|nr:hypothetical protein [Gemmatimonadota bacterium]